MDGRSRGLTRREFVGAAAGALAAGSAYSRPARAATRGRVVVVGAGLAGLAAGRDLSRAGWSVVVLEARRRLGGRVLTLRSPFRAGQHAEAGAEYGDSTQRTLLAYAHEFGLALEPARPASPAATLVYRDGQRAKLSALETPRVRRDITRYERRVAELAAHVNPSNPAAGPRGLDERTAADLLDDLRLVADARWLLEQRLRRRYAVEATHISLLFLCQQARLPAPTRSFRLRDGNDTLPQALAAGLDVRGNHAVGRITISREGVQVDDLSADYCVLATPVPTWDGIAFTPELPDSLQQAVEHVQYGYAAKTLLQYRDRFWEHEGLNGTLLTDLKLEAAWAATAEQPGTPGILAAYTGGPAGLVYSSVDPASRLLLAADEIDDVFPGTRLQVVGGATAGWFGERYSRGVAIAYNRHQVVKYWRVVREPIGRVYLAGEHASLYPGTMEGALRSGRRAAGLISARGR